jgi:hypothetical protein
MAGEQGATQQGVPAAGDAAAKPVQRTAREEAMDAIFDQRLEHYEGESGLKVEREAATTKDVDADPDDAVAAEARKQLEAQTDTNAADTTQADAQSADTLVADSQLAQQAEGDELILDAATLAKAKVRVKIDGTEELVPASKALGQYQKNAAADVRLADATRLQREAQTALEQASAKVAAAGTKTEKVEAQQEVTRAKVALDGFKEASAALFDGDADRASQLFAKAVEAALDGNAGRAQPSTTQTVDSEAVVAEVEQRLSQRSALATLFKDYPEIKADPDYASITDKYVALYVQQGKSVAEAIAKQARRWARSFVWASTRPLQDVR